MKKTLKLIVVAVVFVATAFMAVPTAEAKPYPDGQILVEYVLNCTSILACTSGSFALNELQNIANSLDDVFCN